MVAFFTYTWIAYDFLYTIPESIYLKQRLLFFARNVSSTIPAISY